MRKSGRFRIEGGGRPIGLFVHLLCEEASIRIQVRRRPSSGNDVARPKRLIVRAVREEERRLGHEGCEIRTADPNPSPSP